MIRSSFLNATAYTASLAHTAAEGSAHVMRVQSMIGLETELELLPLTSLSSLRLLLDLPIRTSVQDIGYGAR